MSSITLFTFTINHISNNCIKLDFWQKKVSGGLSEIIKSEWQKYLMPAWSNIVTQLNPWTCFTQNKEMDSYWHFCWCSKWRSDQSEMFLITCGNIISGKLATLLSYREESGRWVTHYDSHGRRLPYNNWITYDQFWMQHFNLDLVLLISRTTMYLETQGRHILETNINNQSINRVFQEWLTHC